MRPATKKQSTKCINLMTKEKEHQPLQLRKLHAKNGTPLGNLLRRISPKNWNPYNEKKLRINRKRRKLNFISDNGNCQIFCINCSHTWPAEDLIFLTEK